MPYEDTGKGTPQVIGLRFVDVKVPKGANVVSAYVEFACDETKDGTLAVSLLIDGERNPNAAPFTTATNDITSRTRTTAKTVWTVVNWTTVGQKDKTSNIASVINEILRQDGWAAGNALAVIISDNPANPSKGVRVAVSGAGPDSAFLHIEYSSKLAHKPTPPTAPCIVTRGRVWVGCRERRPSRTTFTSATIMTT
jgi:hypothetical protein